MKANPGKLGKPVYNGLGKVYTKLTGKDVLSYEEAQGVKQPDGPIRDEGPIDSWDDAPEEKRRKKSGSGKKVIVIVGILAIIAVLAALLPQAIQSLQPPAHDDAIGLDVTGTSGSAETTLNIKLAGPYVYYLHYDFEPKKALSNGDIVTVSIKPDDKRLADLGYGVSGVRTREFSVTGLPEPVTDYHVNGVAVLGHFFAQDIDRQYVNTDDPENPVQTVDTVLETYGGVTNLLARISPIEAKRRTIYLVGRHTSRPNARGNCEDLSR